MSANDILLWLLALCSAWTIAMGIHRRQPYRAVVSLLLLGYLYTLVQLTRPMGEGPFLGFDDLTLERLRGIQYNLVPFHWRDVYPVGSSGFYRQVVGNVLAFMPFTFLVSARDPARARLWKALPLALLLTLGVELSQLACSMLYGRTVRYADIDDVILNTLGGLCGYIAFLPLRGPLRRLQSADSVRV